jgi:hypothetical protein
MAVTAYRPFEVNFIMLHLYSGKMRYNNTFRGLHSLIINT